MAIWVSRSTAQLRNAGTTCGLTAREGVTVLATLTREAVPSARRLRAADPDRAATYRELILALGQELRRRERTSDEPRHLRAVTEDLAQILDALG